MEFSFKAQVLLAICSLQRLLQKGDQKKNRFLESDAPD